MLPNLLCSHDTAGHGLGGADSGFLVNLHAVSDQNRYLHPLQHAVSEQSRAFAKGSCQLVASQGWSRILAAPVETRREKRTWSWLLAG